MPVARLVGVETIFEQRLRAGAARQPIFGDLAELQVQRRDHRARHIAVLQRAGDPPKSGEQAPDIRRRVYRLSRWAIAATLHSTQR
jgi:hypothetical protein